MWFAKDFFLDHFFCFIQIKPDNVAPMRHQRSNIPVTQMKHSFNNFLLGYVNGTLFCAFIDDCLDFIFRYFPFGEKV